MCEVNEIATTSNNNPPTPCAPAWKAAGPITAAIDELRAIGVDCHTYRHPATHRFEPCEWGDHDPCPPAIVGVYAEHGSEETCLACAVSAAEQLAQDAHPKDQVTVEIALIGDAHGYQSGATS